MKDIMREMLARRKAGIHCGIPSYCTASPLAIEAILEQAKRFDDCVLIEATANQVNQFGGYTGMLPKDFTDFVYAIADRVDFNREQIILGGDHLGPLTWSSLPEEQAMNNSVELVKQYVSAGFKKIHLDTSMRLGSDDPNTALSDEIIAERGVILYKACEEAYQELRKDAPDEMRPVFIIGSEVPIPGGAQEEEESISVTKVPSFEATVKVYQDTFHKHGITDAFDNIIAIVVQPGVEFGDADVFQYNRFNAADLCHTLKSYDGLVFEGHSTDYQSAESLRQMVEDGIAILKVGPALTYGLREGLFALSCMEKELIPADEQANFPAVLEQVMLDSPNNWQKHYHGSDSELMLKRKYSFSDRSRYYMADKRVLDAMEKLFQNLSETKIPMNMLHQYMPVQYLKVRDGIIPLCPKALVKDMVVAFVEDYNYAVKHNYVIPNLFVK